MQRIFDLHPILPLILIPNSHYPPTATMNEISLLPSKKCIEMESGNKHNSGYNIETFKENVRLIIVYTVRK